MRLSSELVSSPGRGIGDRLGVRTKKKHKRLDAISEDVFNRNRNVGLRSSDTRERDEGGGTDGSELRRSSRVRKAPQVLDSSPNPMRKRRKVEGFEREGSREGLRVKGKVENEGGGSVFGSSEEELGAWSTRLKIKGKRSRGKRKLFKNVKDDGEDLGFVKDDLEEKDVLLDAEKLGDEDDTKIGSVGGSVEVGNETEDDHSMEESLENEVDELGVEDVDNCTPSTIGRVDLNEEVGPVVPVGEETEEKEIPADAMPDDKADESEHTGESSQTDSPVKSTELAEDVETHCQSTEVDPMAIDLAENKKNDTTLVTDGEVKVRPEEIENGQKVKNSNVAADRIPRPRIKEGRQCGLCGGGTDGKPPKKLVTDSAGSDQEAYSGSSASEEFNFDPWDGFGDEPGWLGSLLGPVNDRHGIAGIWVHQNCAVWSPEVYFAGLGRLKNIRAALCRGRSLKCTRCGRSGATLGCRVDRCPRTYHMPCARATGCNFDHRKFLIVCADHRHLFEPHGEQYSEHIKKLKAKKMRFEIRKLSNDASRKDLEAEEKWMEKCGEDEEFLKRETKRLQRDLLRIAPVYIGGSHSEGENPIGGWDSVAGLQDVVQCMKEVVILPLLYPEFFGNMGITPPRGVLLHGYPGTGKTLVVRALIGACARGDKRIAYFARKGADCLGKYVGDAERQLRLLFQVAEKSQPSIIFFDEIDGLAPVRTRQQDQTHSSVVSTLLALMDGLKSRGSVIVIGATNRPDSVDPALRRPGRFDREIYFPLPSVKDRAAILALHTRKWPKPVSGPLLEWVAAQTIGFAGADLQALCSQAAVVALKRNCSWHRILSCAAEHPGHGKRPELPSFEVDEKDWLEALSLAPPPCSRREAGMAANEVLGTPLDIHLIPCLFQPLLRLIITLYLDDRLWLPLCLVAAGRAIGKAAVSQMEVKNLQNDEWACLAQKMAEDPNIAREILRNLLIVGIVKGDASLTGFDTPKDVSFDDDGTHRCDFGDNPSGLLRNVRYAPLRKTGYRIMISGAPRSGQKHLASCLVHCFLGNIEIQKIDLATISQEGHGDMEQGILRILTKCASLRMCVIFMPRIDFWAIESCSESLEKDDEVSPIHESPNEPYLTPCEAVLSNCSSGPSGTSELEGAPDSNNEICNVSKTWKMFREQLECLCDSSSLIVLATSELPCAAIPCEIRQFFGSEPLATEGPLLIEYGAPRFLVDINEELEHNDLIDLSALNLTKKLIQQFVHVAHLGNHRNTQEDHLGDTRDISAHETDLRSVEEPVARNEPSEDPATNSPVPSGYRNMKEKSTLVLAVATFGYQILRYPHFAELCWITSKLKEGPSADIHGPWKSWPFNSCIVRPFQKTQKDVVVAACNSNNINGKDKFSLVRGLIAVGLSAYQGVYKSSREVSLEVRKVLELLVGQINARIQAGKDRHQYLRLLSQVAYLEDMVNNWSHSLRSLEPEDQIELISNRSGVPSENPQTLTVESMGVEDKPNAKDSVGMHGSIIEDSIAIDINVPAGCTQGNVFQKPDLVDVGLSESLAETSQNAELTHRPVDFMVDNQPDFDVTDKISPENAVNVSDGNQKDVEITDEIPPGKPVDIGRDSRTDFPITDEMSPEMQNEISAEPETRKNGVHLPDITLSRESGEMRSKLEVVCCYGCCAGCISTLQKLVKEIIIRDRELSGSCCTVEDIHDRISSLSTNLCSAVRNLYVTEEFKSLDSNARQCQSSDSGLTKVINCTTHSEIDFPEELQRSSSYDPLGFRSRYIFRNGVLVSEDPDEESSFHCKYDALCLSSLIELIECSKQPVD